MNNTRSAPELSRLMSLWTSMMRIRATEERIADAYGAGGMRCPTHLSIGQEAAAVGVCQALESTDRAMSTHRSHAHYLAKGGSLPAMIAELYGKVSGCSRGRGGSMHLIDLQAGFLGSTAIVGNSIPIGVGLALAARLQKQDSISVVFFGDGATEEGAYYESVNFAVLHRLPVLFICENNFYSVYSNLDKRQPPGRSITQVAQVLGLTAEHGDGNRVWEVFQRTRALATGIREGQGPALLELTTYRWREHCGPNYDNDLGYRAESEFLEWQARDPLRLAETLLDEALPSDAQRRASARVAVQKELDDAFAAAEAAPYPSQADQLSYVYQDRRPSCVR